MVSLTTKAGLTAAAAGAVLLLMSAAPAAAFTLPSSNPAADVTGAGVQQVWYDRWGYWHPNRWRRPWGWYGPGPYWGPGPWRPHRRCWVGPWGGVRCSW